MTDSGPDPRDQELIAAFIDRRMSLEERQAFMRRLDDEEALYEVFVETVRFRDQESARSAAVVVHPAARRQWSRLAAIAAVLAVALATPVLLRNVGDDEYAEVLTANDRLGRGLGPEWFEQGWSRTRGVGLDRPEQDVAFRVGVQAVDLGVALRLERRDEAAILARRLEADLGALELSQPLRLCYEGVRKLIEGGAPRQEALTMAGSTACLFAESFPELESAHSFGRWAEAGRLAARHGNRDLLGSRPFASDLRRLRSGDWHDGVASELETIADLLDAPAEQLDLERLAAAFTAIIDEA